MQNLIDSGVLKYTVIVLSLSNKPVRGREVNQNKTFSQNLNKMLKCAKIWDKRLKFFRFIVSL